MSQPVRRLAAVLRADLRAVLLAAGLAAVAAACGSSTPTASTNPAASVPATGSPGASTASAVATSPASDRPSTETSAPSAIGLPSQSTVEWGRIWDALPPGFPRPAGAVPSEIGVAASGSFDLTQDVATASGVMQGALEAAGFRTEGLSGPFEDGSVVIDSAGPTQGCRLQTTIVRQGGVTTMTVLYGASCPFA
jgi:hypothetical protein